MTAPYRSAPVGFLITFRTYGTWLHGDARGSVDRFHNRYASPRIPQNQPWQKYKTGLLTRSPVAFNARQRSIVEAAIKDTCKIREWTLWAVNVRTNHVHAVASASLRPEKLMNAFKANSTSKMREASAWRQTDSPWARGGSTKWLWSERELGNAVAYVKYGQGLPLDQYGEQ